LRLFLECDDVVACHSILINAENGKQAQSKDQNGDDDNDTEELEEEQLQRYVEWRTTKHYMRWQLFVVIWSKILLVTTSKKSKVSAAFHSRHLYSATMAVTAFRALGVYPEKIASPRIEPGSVAS